MTFKKLRSDMPMVPDMGAVISGPWPAVAPEGVTCDRGRSSFVTVLPALVGVFLGPLAGIHRGEAGEVVSRMEGTAEFQPVIRPHGFEKNKELRLRSEDGSMAVLDKDGKLTPLGSYLRQLASDSANVAEHFHHFFSLESGNWRQVDTPRFKGLEAVNQGHRLPRCLATFTRIAREEKLFSPAELEAMMNERWRTGVEEMFHDMIDGDGFLARDDRKGTMAMSFHFLRTGWKQMELRPERIYTLEKSQFLVRSLLTKPEVINPDDVWLKAHGKFLDKMKQSASRGHDAWSVRVREEEVFFCGGLFIGWKSTLPSCHATWDALAVLNLLYDLHPEVDPASPESIFYLWNREPEENRDIARRTLSTLCKRLWSEHAENGGPTYCWVVDGRPSEDFRCPGEAGIRSDHAGYSRESMSRWAKYCWTEIHGEPAKNSTRGVRKLLEILTISIDRP